MHPHVQLTTQRQVDLLLLLLVARVLVGAGCQLPDWLSFSPFDFDDVGFCKPKRSGWTVGTLLAKIKVNPGWSAKEIFQK